MFVSVAGWPPNRGITKGIGDCCAWFLCLKIASKSHATGARTQAVDAAVDAAAGVPCGAYTVGLFKTSTRTL